MGYTGRERLLPNLSQAPLQKKTRKICVPFDVWIYPNCFFGSDGLGHGIDSLEQSRNDLVWIGL